MNVGVSDHKFQRAARAFDKVKNEGISFCMGQTGTNVVHSFYSNKILEDTAF